MASPCSFMQEREACPADQSPTFRGYPKLCRQLRHVPPCTVAQKTLWAVECPGLNPGLVWQGEAAPLRAVARKELHMWLVLCSHWVAAGTLWSSQLLPLNLAGASLWSYSGTLLPTGSADPSRDAGAHGGRKEPSLAQERSIMLQLGSQLVFSKRELKSWPHLSSLEREQSIPSDFSHEGKRPFNNFPLCPGVLVERPEITSLQCFPMQIWLIFYCQNVYFLSCLHLENCGLRQIVITSK